MSSNAILSLAMAVFFLLILLLSTALPLQSAVLPGLASLCGVICCALLFTRELFGKGTRAEKIRCYGLQDVKKLTFFCISVGILFTLGFNLGGFVFVFLYLHLIGGVTLRRSIILAGLVPIFIILVFQYILQVEIFSGVAICYWSKTAGGC